MSNKPREILTKTRELIADPERWTRRYYATDASGRPVHYMDLSACRFCAIGAFGRVSRDYEHPDTAVAGRVLDEVVLLAHGCSVSRVNDSPDGHSKVLRALDAAIRGMGDE